MLLRLVDDRAKTERKRVKTTHFHLIIVIITQLVNSLFSSYSWVLDVGVFPLKYQIKTGHLVIYTYAFFLLIIVIRIFIFLIYIYK